MDIEFSRKMANVDCRTIAARRLGRELPLFPVK